MPYKDRKDRLAASRKYYAANTKKAKEDSYSRKLKRRAINMCHLRAYLSEHPCVDCGNSDIRVLEFDHVRGEKKNMVTKLAYDGYSLATIKKEIAKCEIRCANCHKIRHFATLA